MKRIKQTTRALFSILFMTLATTACGDKPQEQASQAASVAAGVTETDAEIGAEKADIVARVGDQVITFSQINTMLNSSAVVGVSIPALGTPKRDTVRIALLDKIVSANLLYLDALKRGVGEDPAYQQDLQKFRNGMLMAIYRDRYLKDAIEISDEEIETYYKSSDMTDAKLDEDVRMAIEAVLRKEKMAGMTTQLRAHLRDGVAVQLDDNEMDPLGDGERADTAILASIDGATITWGEVRHLIGDKVGSASGDERRQAMNSYIDQQILVNKASAQGLDKDPVFQARFNEYQKTRLINLHRGNLAREFEPTDEELQAYYEVNRDAIMTPEFRKVQFVVVKTREQADDLKNRIDAGELTMFEAARDYSIDPGAKQNLGEIGWQSRGKGWPELDKVIFTLGPGEIGGPVETPAGWNLLLVQDVQDAQHDDYEQESTRKLTRRKYIHEKLDGYVVNLRKNDFPVEVYEDTLVQLAQQEADMVKQLVEKAAESGSVTQQRLEELQKIYK